MDKKLNNNETKHTIDDYYIEDGIAWGFKRLFKDKNYKQRLLDWRELKSGKQIESIITVKIIKNNNNKYYYCCCYSLLVT